MQFFPVKDKLNNLITENNSILTKVIKFNKELEDSFYFIGVPLDFGFSPYETVMIKNVDTGKSAPGMVVLDPSLKEGVSLSEDLNEFLKLPLGGHLELTFLYSILPINRIKVVPVEEEQNSITEDFKFKLTKTILDRFKYCYLTSGFVIQVFNAKYKLLIMDTNKSYGQITNNTIFYSVVSSKQEELTGHKKAYQYLSQILLWPTYYAKEFKDLEIKVPKGVILYGPPGTGKTHILRQVLNNTKWKVITVKGPELLSKYVGGSESALRKVFETAKANSPAIILFDEIDAIASKREGSSEHDQKLVSQLLSCMDGLEARGAVMVLATTNRIDQLDPALRRPGRFDKEILIPPPNIDQRKSLIKTFTQKVPLDEDLDYDQLATLTNGYVHADLKLLCNQAKLNVISRTREQDSTEGEKESLPLTLTKDDFVQAMKKVLPSLLRQYEYTQTKVTLKEVIGYDKVKDRLFTEVTYPIRYSKIFQTQGVKPIKGLILSGPPGTGKTTLAKALANELNYNFIFVSGNQILSKYVGETEHKITDLFNKARMVQPSLIFIDELDGLLGGIRSENLQPHEVGKLGTFLSQMDGITNNQENIFLIGTTNRIDLLDPALLRAGRFELHLNMSYPDKDQLLKLYKYYFPHVEPEFDWTEIVNLSLRNKLVGADVASLKRLVVSSHLSKQNLTEISQWQSEYIIFSQKEILDCLGRFMVEKYSKEKKLLHAY